MSQPNPSQAARKVELIIAQLDSLPTLPRIATQLLRLTRSDEASTRQVIELIKQDQAVTAKILSMARRAGSGVRSEAATIDRCVLMMGLEAVRSAALSIKIFEVFDPAADAGVGQFDLAAFWKHSLAVALASEAIALALAEGASRNGPLPNADEAFVAGLLHDIGKAALHHCLPKSYAKVIEAAESSHAPLATLERKLIGIDHTVVGKRLAQRWNLPAGVIDAVWLHHSPPAALPDSVRQRGFAQVVHLADLVVRELHLGYSGNYPRAASSAEQAGELGLSRGQLARIMRQLPDQLATRASLIGMEQLDSRDLYYEALTVANDELSRMNARLLTRGASLASKARYFDLLGQFNRQLRPGCDPFEAAARVAQLFAGLVNADRLVVFSEPPAGHAAAADPDVEGVVIDAADPQHPERFVLSAEPGEVEALAAARRQGWFDPAQSPEGFSLYPLEGHLAWTSSRLARPLPSHNGYLLPLVAEGAWVGAVVFAPPAGAPPMPDWPDCRAELFALAAAAGQAIRTAQLAVARERTAEELAQAAETCARLQDQLIRQRALASVGEMAAGAGHELNNPLMVISGRSELLASDEPDPQRRQTLEQIKQNAQRASNIITELMAFARPPKAAPQKVDLTGFVREITGPFRESHIDVTLNLAGDLPPAWVDPGQLQEVVQEVLDNAQQAMAAQDANRQIIVTLTQAPPTAGLADRNEGRLLEVVITDTGVGMAPEVLEHATEPFFSARPAGRGRGLGLARARRLIEHNGGAMRIESTPGVGTTVHIFVPVAEG